MWVTILGGVGAIDYKVKPGLVKREIIHSGMYILGLKYLCNRWQQLISTFKCKTMREVKAETCLE